AWLQGEVRAAQLAYWQRQLCGPLPVLDLATDRRRPAVQTSRGASAPVTVSRALTTALRALSQRHGVTLFMTLLAGFQLLLARYTGQTDVIVGTPIAHRTRSEGEGLIGVVGTTLALRT